MKALCIGHITYDTTLILEEYPLKNKKIDTNKKEEGPGGPATISALLLSKWNVDTELIGQVGEDESGKKIKKILKENKVNIENIYKTKETDQSYIITENQSRTVITYEPNGPLNENLEIEKPDIILIDGFEPKISLDILKKYNKTKSIMDAGRYTHDMVTLAKEVDYLICSKDFAEDFTNIKIQDQKDLIKVYKKMKETFTNTLIITLGEEGCIYTYKNALKKMPSLKVKVKDTTGAGDIFHGAFTYAITKYDLETAIKIATISSAISVTKIGAYSSIPSLEEMWSVYSDIK